MFSINGVQKDLPLNGLAAACVQEYVDKHPEMSAADVIQAWKGAGFNKPHYPSYFIMSQTDYNNWNGSNKNRVCEIQVGTDIIYVIRDGFNKNNIKSFINGVNASNLGITITIMRNNMFSINGVQKNLPLNGLAAACVEEYVNQNPGMSAANVVQAWKGAGFDKPHYPSYFIMSQTVYNNWNGSNKNRVCEIQVGTDIIYVIRDGFNKNNIKSFINNVNASNLGITIK